MPVLFHRLAAQEFVQARRQYARRSAQAESRFVAAVNNALTFIKADPLLAPAYQGNHRWQRVRRFPYVIYFEPIAAGARHRYSGAPAPRRPGAVAAPRST